MIKKILGIFKIKKLTTFDLIVGGGVVIALIFFSFFFLRKTEWKKTSIKVYSWGGKSANWLADSLEIGMEEKDGLGRKMAVIEDLKIYEREGDQKDLYLNLALKTYYDSKKRQHFFKNQNLSIGSPIKLNFSGVFVQGLIVDIEGLTAEKIFEEKIVEARLVHYTDVFPETLGVQPWLAEAVKVGDEMADTQGRVIARILEKNVTPAQKIVVTDQGKVFVTDDPFKKDVYLKIWLLTWKRKEISYFFDDVKVKIDQGIPLYFSKATIYPVITKILQ